MTLNGLVQRWPVVVPVLAVLGLYALLDVRVDGWHAWGLVAVLVLVVIASVHHAEVIAHRLGEPYGTLVLALAVTVFETSLVVSWMLSNGPASAALPRDTI